MPFDAPTDGGTNQFDIGIVGGGPSGLAASIYAALQGYSVIIFEPKPDTIDKACGEGLMPSAVQELIDMGVHIPESHPFKGIRYISEKGTLDDSPSHRADGFFKSGDGLGVRRLTLHQALTSRAQELGVQWSNTRVQHVEQSAENVVIEGTCVRYCLAADGLHSSMRKRLNLSKPSTLPKRVGIRQHFEVAPWSPFVEVYWSEFGECYITPVSDSQVGVAILAYADNLPSSDHGGKFDALLDWFPIVKSKLAGATPLSSVRGAGGFEQRVSSPIEGRILLIGDAAGYLDPITGEGIRLGLLSAKAAIQSIHENAVHKYKRRHQLILLPYWVLTGGLLWLRRFKLGRRVMVPFLQRVPFAFGRIVSALGG